MYLHKKINKFNLITTDTYVFKCTCQRHQKINYVMFDKEKFFEIT